MKPIVPTAILATICVVMASLAQIALKQGLSNPRVHEALQNHQWITVFWQLSVSPPMVVGVLLYTASTLIWFYALTLADVSYLYPFLGFGFVLTTATAALYLGETVTIMRWSGVLLIVAGVVIVSRS